MLNIGYRAHDFGAFPSAEKLGERLKQLEEHSSIQLALNKVIKTALPWQEWTDSYISQITETLASYGVDISIVGCYINMIDPDTERRKEAINRFKLNLSLSKAFKCKNIATETGSCDINCGYSPKTANPENLEIFYTTLSEMINAAEKYDALVLLEPVAHAHTISTLERVSNLIERFPSNRLRLLFDPVNFTPFDGIKEKDGTSLAHPSKEAMKKFYTSFLDVAGDKLSAVHCKDYVLDVTDGHKVGDLPALTGVFNWKGFISALEQRHINVPWILEDLNPATCINTKNTLLQYQKEIQKDSQVH